MHTPMYLKTPSKILTRRGQLSIFRVNCLKHLSEETIGFFFPTIDCLFSFRISYKRNHTIRTLLCETFLLSIMVLRLSHVVACISGGSFFFLLLSSILLFECTTVCLAISYSWSPGLILVILFCFVLFFNL